MELGKRIKHARKEAELTQLEVAQKVNVSRATVINWELGRTNPTALQLKKLAEICNKDIDCFYQ